MRSSTKGRLRLGVIQVLVLTLFLTLFGRLWYLQVFSGDDYQAKAADQSVREIVEQPARGLIVDDMGRPLVANRTSWVVTIDRTLLGKMARRAQKRLLQRIARAVAAPVHVDQGGDACSAASRGRSPGECWNGSPYQPVPIAEDIRQQTALRIMEQNEDFPAVIVEDQNVRAYPRPTASTPRTCSATSARSPSPSWTRPRRSEDETLHGASVVGRAGLEKEYDQYLRGIPGYKQVAVDSMGRVLGDSDEVQGTVGDTLVTSIDARVQSVVEQQLAKSIRRRPRHLRPGDRAQLRRRLGGGRRDGGRHRTASSRWRASRRTTPTCGSAESTPASSTGSTPPPPAPRFSAGPPRASSPRAPRGSRS